MGERFGPLTEADYEDNHLYETVGHVVEINVEQEGTRQALHFMLRIYTGVEPAVRSRDQKCKVYLDVNTTTVMAQLQLLRDAMWSAKLGVPYLCHIHFNFATKGSEEWIYVYWLSILLTSAERVTVAEFRGSTPAGSDWYFHDS